MDREQREGQQMTPPIDPGEASNAAQSSGWMMDLLLPFGMAFLGAVAKLAASKGCCRSWRRTLRSLFVSGFAGMVVTLLLVDTDLPPSTVGAISGVAAYSGAQSLDRLADGLATMAQWMIGKLPGGK